ncbi:MAG: RnfABCDGE type electron transport complex subunit G [Spirochaetes bacterium]|nr:RnfABCDGE type electron transport complex subunit G [Spirochaetota bacterium]
MNSIVKPTLILGLVALISAWVLSLVNSVTAPRIAQLQRDIRSRALETVLPGYTVEEEKKVTVNGKELTYWRAAKKIDEKTSRRGYAFIASGQGYSGEVQSIVGVDDTGRIIAISIVLQSETPGLGARCQELASKKTLAGVFLGGNNGPESTVPWFQQQFAGLDLNRKIQVLKKGDWNPDMQEELQQQNAISAITGATITSRTVKESIERGMEMLRSAESFTPPAEEAAK